MGRYDDQEYQTATGNAGPAPAGQPWYSRLSQDQIMGMGTATPSAGMYGGGGDSGGSDQGAPVWSYTDPSGQPWGAMNDTKGSGSIFYHGAGNGNINVLRNNGSGWQAGVEQAPNSDSWFDKAFPGMVQAFVGTMAGGAALGGLGAAGGEAAGAGAGMTADGAMSGAMAGGLPSLGGGLGFAGEAGGTYGGLGSLGGAAASTGATGGSMGGLIDGLTGAMDSGGSGSGLMDAFGFGGGTDTSGMVADGLGGAMDQGGSGSSLMDAFGFPSGSTGAAGGVGSALGDLGMGPITEQSLQSGLGSLGSLGSNLWDKIKNLPLNKQMQLLTAALGGIGSLTQAGSPKYQPQMMAAAPAMLQASRFYDPATHNFGGMSYTPFGTGNTAPLSMANNIARPGYTGNGHFAEGGPVNATPDTNSEHWKRLYWYANGGNNDRARITADGQTGNRIDPGVMQSEREYPVQDANRAAQGMQEQVRNPRIQMAKGGQVGGLSSLNPQNKAVAFLRSHYRSKKDAQADTQVPGSPASQVLQSPDDPLLDQAFSYQQPQGQDQGYARGGMISDGMSDSIPASINGQAPAKLSEGEYVVPADVVSHLGNGSTKAGSKHMDSMVSRIRAARTGRTSQAPQINAPQFTR